MKNIALAVFFGVVGIGGAGADPRDDALSAVLRCSGVSDKAQRLLCYDSAVVRVPGALNTNSAPSGPPMVAASAVPPPAPAFTPRRKRNDSFMDRLLGGGPKRAPQHTVAEFGSESVANGGRQAFPIPMDNDTIDQISARLVSYTFNDGYVVVSLDNGQVWRQTADGKPLQSLSRPALAYSALIARGGAGSYDMKLSGIGRIIAVRRIR